MTPEEVLEEHGVNLQWIKTADLAPPFLKLAETIVALRERNAVVPQQIVGLEVQPYITRDGISAVWLKYKGHIARAYYKEHAYHGIYETSTRAIPFYGDLEHVGQAFVDALNVLLIG